MGGQRAEDERDGAGVGLDEADARRGERFVGDEVGEAGGVGGVGARTAARAGGGEAAAEAAAEAVVRTTARIGGDAVGKSLVPAAGKVGDRLPAEATDSQILGHRLSMARQKAGLSIEDVAAATRIRPGMVREIEAGDFGHCGGDVYARGHVRAIAKRVGIDPEPLLTAHPPVVPAELPMRYRGRAISSSASATAGTAATAADSGTAPPTAGAAVAASSPSPGSLPDSAAVPTSAARDAAARFAGRPPSRVIRPAAEGAVLGAAGASATPSTAKDDKAKRSGPVAAIATGTAIPVRPPQAGRKNDPGTIERQPKSANWTAAMLVALLGLVVFAGVQLMGGDGGKTTAAAVPAAPAPKPVAVKPPPPPAPAPPKDVEVKIAAVGADSWLYVAAPDGHVLFDNLLPAGSSQSFKDPKQLGVTLGNASAVHMNLNGKDLGAAGGDGQVVHVTLSPTGAVTG